MSATLRHLLFGLGETDDSTGTPPAEALHWAVLKQMQAGGAYSPCILVARFRGGHEITSVGGVLAWAPRPQTGAIYGLP